MVIFKNIRYKNFLSTGNQFNTFDLAKHRSTLITGKNGEGKSTVLCALTYVLFGKPFRNINKPQLINSINQKNLLVEIEFSIGTKNYLVRRGMKPNIFEIYCNGQILNEEADTRDYQKILEQQILKFNYKTFTQVVILGSATFVPFMQLSAQRRREVIEDILDIKVFSTMNLLLKSKVELVKEHINNVERELESCKIRISSQQKLISVLEDSRKTAVDALYKKIKSNQETIKINQESISQLNLEIEQLQQKQSKYAASLDAVNQAEKMLSKYKSTLQSLHEECRFFEDNTVCVTCNQELPDQYKQNIIQQYNDKIETNSTKLRELDNIITSLNKQVVNYQNIMQTINDKMFSVTSLNSAVTLLNKTNTELNKEIENANCDTSNINVEEEKLKQLTSLSIDLVDKKTSLLNDKQLYDTASSLLKDTGIKTAIIHEYLPTMNKLINKYLVAMDFYAKFELDESFQEVIKSRNRDVFTYNSFSEGEKRRLDLAILFAWRQIAKMKNSVNTNIMILDEILDGSLDGGGIDYFLSIMNQFGENTNVFVISHREVADKFDHIVRIEKRQEFSIIC